MSIEIPLSEITATATIMRRTPHASYLLAFVLTGAAGWRAPPLSSRRAVAQSCAALLSCGLMRPHTAAPHTAALAAAEPDAVPCDQACFKECNAIAPGNEAYCRDQCNTYCAEQGPTGASDVLRSDVTAGSAASDCSRYQTEKAKAYCASQNQKAAAGASAAAKPATGLEMNNGIFGDSGVSYSKGVEDLFANAFGATRQSKDVKEADVGAFASDIGSAAKAALFGK